MNNMSRKKITKEFDKWENMLLDGVKIWQLPENERPKGIHIVGVIPDLHAPFHNKKALSFLIQTFIQRGVTDIVCIGDFFDHFWESKKYVKNYNVMGPTEMKKATQAALNLFAAEFPYVKYVIGNHCLRIVASSEDTFFEDFEEALKRKYIIPEGWDFKMEHIIDGVCYIHGMGVSGQNAALTMMRTKRISTVIGHTHSFASVQYSNNGLETNFAMNVGSLIDPSAPVFEYGVTNKEKPVLSCGVVYNRNYAEVIPLIK
jgi:UDP-2,3-diacylglucosamine pyrophosphatase LpxH